MWEDRIVDLVNKYSGLPLQILSSIIFYDFNSFLRLTLVRLEVGKVPNHFTNKETFISKHVKSFKVF